jgi:hypothetical protein
MKLKSKVEEQNESYDSKFIDDFVDNPITNYKFDEEIIKNFNGTYE